MNAWQCTSSNIQTWRCALLSGTEYSTALHIIDLEDNKLNHSSTVLSYECYNRLYP